MIIINKKLNFSIVFHFHQPVDNFDHVIQFAYENSYLPLLNTIFDHPKIKCGLHFSGGLLEWLMRKHPEYIDLIKDLGKRNQIEILSGGFYEPIFAVIPDEDKLAQINKLKDFIKTNFNLESYGFWLAERVWEPHLPRILELAKLKYILIDDFHIKANGLSEIDTFYPYITEEQGSKITVVPINEPLRYLTPWKKAEVAIEYLSKYQTDKGDRLITLIDDAEKMGVWPAGDRTTYDICFGTGYDGTPWLPKFFELLEDSDWLNIITINEYLQKYKPRGLIYMPTASYDKMSYWVLPTHARKRLENLIQKAKNNEIPYSKDILEFVKGGFWRGFLIKYYESNAMHKKMLYIRDKLKLVESLYGLDYKGEKIEAIKNAWDHIYRAQCNDCYWHGQFGGIYFGFMRQAVYHHLIKAEKIVENIMFSYKNPITPSIREYDINFCGRNEILMETNMLNVYIDCFHGGSIFEIDEKETQQNILNVLQRRREAYHDENVQLPFDRWRKYAFMDHFTSDSLTQELIINDAYNELGNFVDSQYEHSIKQDNDKIIAFLWKSGEIKLNDYVFKIKISKSIEVLEKNHEILVKYKIQNLSEKDLEINYLTEIPFYLSGDLSQTNINIPGNDFPADLNQQFNTNEIRISSKDLKLSFDIKISEECLFFGYPLISFISTDGTKNPSYQGTCMTLVKKLNIDAGAEKNFNILLNVYKNGQ
ncbi:MAG: alpha-amylase/4-alpha-glucanotransferase domain-containing protein [Candidatus Helarchaeota archaeon]